MTNHLHNLSRKIARRDFVAGLILSNPKLAPVFKRLDMGVASAQIEADAVAAARAVVKTAIESQ